MVKFSFSKSHKTHKFIENDEFNENVGSDRWPIEWKNPLGYLPAFAQQYLSAMCIAHLAICTTAFITGSCWLLISVIEDIKIGFQTLDRNVKLGTNQLELLIQFVELLELHADAKQFSNNRFVES